MTFTNAKPRLPELFQEIQEVNSLLMFIDEINPETIQKVTELFKRRKELREAVHEIYGRQLRGKDDDTE